MKGKMANEWEPGVLTLEHVLPKKPNDDWKALLKADKDIVDDCVARLGNMCLLTKINKELGSKGFAAKKPTYKASEIKTTKDLASFAAWDRTAIDKRQEQMAKRARLIWRFP